MQWKDRSDYTLELSADAMKQLVETALVHIMDYIKTLPDQPASQPGDHAKLVNELKEPLPEAGTPYSELFDFLFQKAVGPGFNSASPGYLAYVPGGGILHAAVADLISDTVNRHVGVDVAAPGLVQLEANVVRWFCDMVGYPAEAGGFLTTGGSLANFSALFTARRTQLPEQFLSGTIYTSDQAHHSVQKAAVLTGFPPDRVRVIPSEGQFRLPLEPLQRVIAEDRQAGWTPFAVVAHAGTTNTGAVDPLEPIAEVAQTEGLWLHVDAAYGGFFVLTERGQQRLRGLERADSITLDPHKGLFLPYGTGSLLVRNRNALKQAHGSEAAYLPDRQQEEEELVDYGQMSPELSREFRGLRVWLPIKMHGIGPFRAALEEKLDLVEWASEELRRIEDIELCSEPELATVAFRLYRPDCEASKLNQLNQQFLERINARRRVLLSGTWLGDRFALRICALCFRTHWDRMAVCLEDIRAARETVWKG